MKAYRIIHKDGTAYVKAENTKSAVKKFHDTIHGTIKSVRIVKIPKKK